MSANRTYVITKRTSEARVYLTNPGFKRAVWTPNVEEAITYHSRFTAEKAARSHCGTIIDKDACNVR